VLEASSDMIYEGGFCLKGRGGEALRWSWPELEDVGGVIAESIKHDFLAQR
jgi:hypothetical protein